MIHRPRTLALLISLIGSGVSLEAQAYNELPGMRGADATLPVLDAEPGVPADSALELTRWSPGLVWRAEQGPLDLSRVMLVTRNIAETHLPPVVPAAIEPAAQPLDIAAAVDEVPQEPGTALVHPATAEEVRALAAAPKPRIEGPWQRIRAVLRSTGKSARPFAPALAAQAAPAAVERSAAQVASPSLLGEVPDVAPRSPAARIRFVAQSEPAQQPDPAAQGVSASAHAEQLMQSLSTVLHDDVSRVLRQGMLSRLARRFPAAFESLLAGAEQPAFSAAVAPPIEHRAVRVASPADRVLRQLEAILDKSAAPPEELIVATQSDRVLAVLQDLWIARTIEKHRSARDQRRQSRALSARPIATAPARVAALSAADAAPAARGIEIDIDINLDRLLPLLVEPVATSASLPPLQASVALPPLPSTSPFGGRGLAVAESALDRVRGGFVTDGLNISFGIERAVYVNGALVTSTSLNVSDLGRITAGRGTAAFDAGTLALIQSGAGNLVTTGGLSSTSLGSVIQNTLDGQQIQNVTVINATVNSLGVLRGLNLQSSLRGAVIDSLRR